MSPTSSADNYQRAGADLDDHLRTCAVCQTGIACVGGDQAADAEYRAWRQWQHDDPTADGSRQKGSSA